MAYNPGSGYRWSRGYGNGHYGQDWGADKGTAISVAAAGVVVSVTEQPLGANGKSWGKYVVVMHTGTDGNAYYTLYAHMSNNQIVKEGDQVSKGQKIGEVGNTGVGTGDHLHFEVRSTDKPPNGDWYNSSKPVNPFTFNWDTLGGAYNYIDVFLRDFAISHGLLRLLTDTNGFAPDSLLDNFSIPDSFSRYFTRATQWRPSSDPLTLDLDGDGIETVGINTNNPILFDHNADGVKTATGWIKGDDGLLVLDRNGNGAIDNGKELFGDSTVMSNGQTAADGFAALADLDSNADGQINANDAQFGSLKVWRDLNQDGISQSNELSTLEQQNIASISVAKTENNQLLGDGNRIMDLGTYTKTDGTTGTTGATGQTGDVDFAENTFYTDFTDSPPITPEAALLPNMEGSGLVRDLREAASIRGDLASVLNTYASATTRAEQIIKGQKAKGELSAVSF